VGRDKLVLLGGLGGYGYRRFCEVPCDFPELSGLRFTDFKKESHLELR
jgi:hypothetical protein